jgi:hypothetical protein
MGKLPKYWSGYENGLMLAGNKMHMKQKPMFGLLLTFMACAAIASASQLLTFDDLSTSCYDPITNGYAGFNWTNVWVANGVCLGDGYLTGTISPPNVAFNGYGADASFDVVSGTFSLTSAYVTSVNGSSSITVMGYNGSTLLYNNAYPVNGAAPTFITFGYDDITWVYITGGKFALDNITINGSSLTITPIGTSVVLTWPTNATGLTLQSTTNLASPVWTTNSTLPVLVNGQNTVTNPVLGTQQFYRLSQ